MKQVYFISDAHLGSWALDHRRMQERPTDFDKEGIIYTVQPVFQPGMAQGGN